MKATDISNYTSDLTSETLAAWKADGVELVIVQAVDPPAGYPAGKTREQIQACLDAGLAVDAYVWLWFDLDVTDILHKLTLLDGLPIRRLWLDVEDTAAVKYSTVACKTKVSAALGLCDAYPTTEWTGIYTGGWFWRDTRYMGDTTAFDNRDLWDSNYDGNPDTAAFTPYGGWEECAIKQWQGTSDYLGVSGVDLNVLSEQEAAAMSGNCDALKTALERGVNRLQIETNKKTTLSKVIIREIASEMFQALQT